jgi:hypothetical protein
MSEFRREGLIDVRSRRAIVLLNRVALSERAGGGIA